MPAPELWCPFVAPKWKSAGSCALSHLKPSPTPLEKEAGYSGAKECDAGEAWFESEPEGVVAFDAGGEISERAIFLATWVEYDLAMRSACMSLVS